MKKEEKQNKKHIHELLNKYMNECSAFFNDSDTIRWFVDNWDIIIDSSLLNEELSLEHKVNRINRASIECIDYIRNSNKDIAISLFSKWYEVDINKFQIVEINKNTNTKTVENHSIPSISTIVKEDDEFSLLETFYIDKNKIDRNTHLNNVKYLDIFFKYIDDNANIKRINIKYHKQLLKDINYELYASIGEEYTRFIIKQKDIVLTEAIIVY